MHLPRALISLAFVASCKTTAPPAAPAAPEAAAPEAAAPEAASSEPATTAIDDPDARASLAQIAQSEAPGAHVLTSGRVRIEGNVIELPVDLAPGACITAIAIAPDADVAASLVLPGGTDELAAGTTGKISVAGGRSGAGCWKNPTPLGGRIALRLTGPNSIVVYFEVLST